MESPQEVVTKIKRWRVLINPHRIDAAQAHLIWHLYENYCDKSKNGDRLECRIFN
jgi:hypothetical protein